MGFMRAHCEATRHMSIRSDFKRLPLPFPEPHGSGRLSEGVEEKRAGFTPSQRNRARKLPPGKGTPRRGRFLERLGLVRNRSDKDASYGDGRSLWRSRRDNEDGFSERWSRQFRGCRFRFGRPV